MVGYNDYKKIRCLGQGQYGKVNLVKHKATNALFVWKKLRSTGRNGSLLQNEYSILSILKSPFLVGYVGAFLHKNNFYIIMDYCDKLTFKHLIEEHAKKMTYIPEEEILNYLAMITMGLAEMHRKFIIHFDLKPENIFLFGDKYVKIGDFGTSVSLGSDKNKVKKLVGTQYYVSPEMLDGEPCNMSTDIWSLGVILYQLIQLHLPFDASNLIDLSSKIRRGIPAVPFQQMKCSQQLKEIVQWLLEPDPSKRPTAVQLLEHSLLKERAQRLFRQVPPSLRLVDEKLIYVRPGEEKDDINKYQLNMGQHLHGIQYVDEQQQQQIQGQQQQVQQQQNTNQQQQQQQNASQTNANTNNDNINISQTNDEQLIGTSDSQLSITSIPTSTSLNSFLNSNGQTVTPPPSITNQQLQQQQNQKQQQQQQLQSKLNQLLIQKQQNFQLQQQQIMDNQRKLAIQAAQAAKNRNQINYNLKDAQSTQQQSKSASLAQQQQQQTTATNDSTQKPKSLSSDLKHTKANISPNKNQSINSNQNSYTNTINSTSSQSSSFSQQIQIQQQQQQQQQQQSQQQIKTQYRVIPNFQPKSNINRSPSPSQQTQQSSSQQQEQQQQQEQEQQSQLSPRPDIQQKQQQSNEQNEQKKRFSIPTLHMNEIQKNNIQEQLQSPSNKNKQQISKTDEIQIQFSIPQALQSARVQSSSSLMQEHNRINTNNNKNKSTDQNNDNNNFNVFQGPLTERVGKKNKDPYNIKQQKPSLQHQHSFQEQLQQQQMLTQYYNKQKNNNKDSNQEKDKDNKNEKKEKLHHTHRSSKDSHDSHRSNSKRSTQTQSPTQSQSPGLSPIHFSIQSVTPKHLHKQSSDQHSVNYTGNQTQHSHSRSHTPKQHSISQSNTPTPSITKTPTSMKSISSNKSNSQQSTSKSSDISQVSASSKIDNNDLQYKIKEKDKNKQQQQSNQGHQTNNFISPLPSPKPSPIHFPQQFQRDNKQIDENNSNKQQQQIQQDIKLEMKTKHSHQLSNGQLYQRKEQEQEQNDITEGKKSSRHHHKQKENKTKQEKEQLDQQQENNENDNDYNSDIKEVKQLQIISDIKQKYNKQQINEKEDLKSAQTERYEKAEKKILLKERSKSPQNPLNPVDVYNLSSDLQQQQQSHQSNQQIFSQPFSPLNLKQQQNDQQKQSLQKRQEYIQLQQSLVQQQQQQIPYIIFVNLQQQQQQQMPLRPLFSNVDVSYKPKPIVPFQSVELSEIQIEVEKIEKSEKVEKLDKNEEKQENLILNQKEKEKENNRKRKEKEKSLQSTISSSSSYSSSSSSIPPSSLITLTIPKLTVVKQGDWFIPINPFIQPSRNILNTNFAFKAQNIGNILNNQQQLQQQQQQQWQIQQQQQFSQQSSNQAQNSQQITHIHPYYKFLTVFRNTGASRKIGIIDSSFSVPQQYTPGRDQYSLSYDGRTGEITYNNHVIAIPQSHQQHISSQSQQSQQSTSQQQFSNSNSESNQYSIFSQTGNQNQNLISPSITFNDNDEIGIICFIDAKTQRKIFFIVNGQILPIVVVNIPRTIRFFVFLCQQSSECEIRMMKYIQFKQNDQLSEFDQALQQVSNNVSSISTTAGTNYIYIFEWGSQTCPVKKSI